MNATNSNVRATVFIPTWFGEQYLDELLKAVFSQKVDYIYEVLVFDTSSTDKTPEILEKYIHQHSNFRYKTITKAEYGHGKTRNAAAQEAKGEFIVYLSQDATPAHDRWLYEMIRPFEINEKIMAVMGKQIPRNHCFPLLKNEIRSVFANLGPDYGTTLFYRDEFMQDDGVKAALSFYSDVNSAARRKFLLENIPYRDVPYAEDQLFGRDIIEAGYYKAYAPRGSVVHSNEMKLGEYKYRMFDEILGLRKIGNDIVVPSLKNIIKMISVNSVKDSVHIIKDEHYSKKRKLFWLATNPIYHVEKWRGYRRAATTELNNEDMIDINSLESRRHKKNG